MLKTLTNGDQVGIDVVVDISRRTGLAGIVVCVQMNRRVQAGIAVGVYGRRFRRHDLLEFGGDLIVIFCPGDYGCACVGEAELFPNGTGRAIRPDINDVDPDDRADNQIRFVRRVAFRSGLADTGGLFSVVGVPGRAIQIVTGRCACRLAVFKGDRHLRLRR